MHMVLMQTWCVLDLLWCYTIMLNHTSNYSGYTPYNFFYYINPLEEQENDYLLQIPQQENNF